MRGKKLLAAFLLGVGLCFVPALGYGEVQEWTYERKASYMEICLLRAEIDYMMNNPTNFLSINFYYDPDGRFGRIEKLPESISTKSKIFVVVRDTRRVFSDKSGIVLLDEFKKELEVIYSYSSIGAVAMDMNADIVAIFCDRENIPLGYFYQGEYHLWKE